MLRCSVETASLNMKGTRHPKSRVEASWSVTTVVQRSLKIQYERRPYQLIEIQLRSGRLAEAESAMRRGLDIHPTYEWGHWLLGVVLVAKGDRDGALIEMERVT